MQEEFSKFVSPVDFPLLVQPNEEIQSMSLPEKMR